jgi:peptidoglycan/xylan/chitin deacetylase (PgdA/CDA1 family)
MSAREVLVCFDFEGRWGMPFAADYDLDASTHRILETLARHRARGIFFIVGELAVEHPDLIASIGAGGHELALHGWRHEHLDRLDPDQLTGFERGLEQATRAIQDVTGRRPIGFRAPYLLAPRFYNPRVYEILAEHGYRWTSNRELRHVVELLRPDRLRTERPWRFVASHPKLLDPSAAFLLYALNGNAYLSARSGRSVLFTHRWLRSGRPFFRGSLLEIPLYSPLDCDLLGCPPPAAKTPAGLLEYARYALETSLIRADWVSMLTFHDWIVGGVGRLELLDSLLSFIASSGMRTIGVDEEFDSLTRMVEGFNGVNGRKRHHRFRPGSGGARAKGVETIGVEERS